MAYKEKLLNDGDILYAEHLNNMMRGISESVSYTEQKLTEEQKAKARENIGMGDISNYVNDAILNGAW